MRQFAAKPILYRKVQRPMLAFTIFPKWIIKENQMKTKFNKESRNLLIALLIGDGTISNNQVFKLAHKSKEIF